MTTDIEFPAPAETFGHSMLWDVVVPMAIIAVPPATFKLMGIMAVTEGLDKPGGTAPGLVFITLILLEILGIISLAIVSLTRFDRTSNQLLSLTNGQAPQWRRLVLLLSFISLLLSDVLTNVSALPGAGFLVIGAVPAFVSYIVCKHVIFVGLTASQQDTATA